MIGTVVLERTRRRQGRSSSSLSLSQVFGGLLCCSSFFNLVSSVQMEVDGMGMQEVVILDQDVDESTIGTGEGFGELQQMRSNPEVITLLEKTKEYMSDLEKTDSILWAQCTNEHEYCTYWATVGQCESYAAFMTVNCAPACQTCHLMDKKQRCAVTDEFLKNVALKPGELNEVFERIIRLEEEDGGRKWDVTVHSRPAAGEESSASSSGAEEKDGAVMVDEDADQPWVITIDDFLSDEECETIAGLAYGTETGGYQRSTTVSSPKDERRTSETSWCIKDCDQDVVVQRVHDRISDLVGIPTENMEFMQILKYDEGNYYTEHHDFLMDKMGEPCGPRVLTLFMYLGDVEAGGETQFTSLVGAGEKSEAADGDVSGDDDEDKGTGNLLKIAPKKGRAVLWPNVMNSHPGMKDPRTNHEALPVMRGEKFAANAWIHLKGFRQMAEKGCC